MFEDEEACINHDWDVEHYDLTDSFVFSYLLGSDADICTGTGLTIPSETRKLLKFSYGHEPEVVIMGPPGNEDRQSKLSFNQKVWSYVSITSWSRMNRNTNTISYAACRQIDDLRAELAGQIALFQLHHRRHLSIVIFELFCVVQLWATGKVGCIVFPQCACGVNVYWEAILKMTEVRASSPHLPEPFEELACRCERREELEGKRKTSLAATWPLGMCRKIEDQP